MNRSSFLRQTEHRTVTLWLTYDHAQAIARHAQEESPREACGLIVGVSARADHTIPIPNVAADPLHNYEMDSAAFMLAMAEVQRARLQLIGIYHSHPHSEPLPSPTDIACASYPDTPYVIVSLYGSHPCFAAWNIRGHRVERADLHIGINSPPPAPTNLSSAGKTAIVISIAVAFIFLIVLSLALLPPAPPIP